jgi:Kef-type K+ transport system membrane component KefB
VGQPSGLTLAELAADMAVILGGGALLVACARRLRQPAVIAEITAGIVLGPSVLGLLPGNLPARLFPSAVRPLLSAVAEIGILLFMFLVGAEFDMKAVRGRRSTVFGVSLTSMALPFGCGVALGLWLYRRNAVVDHHRVAALSFVLFVGTAMAITAFPVLARIIRERRLQATEVGTLALGSAAIGDTLAWCMLAFVSALVTSKGLAGLGWVVCYSVCYAAVLWLVIRPLLRRILTRMTSLNRRPPYLLTLIVAGIFLSAYVTTLIGLDAIIGAFAFGLALPANSAPAVEQQLKRPIENLAALLMPVFFIVTGLSVDLTRIGLSGLPELAAIIAVACLGKLIGAITPAKLSGMSWRDSATLGVLMNTRGLTELIILNVGVALHVLNTRMLTLMVLMALITTGMAGPFVRRREQERPGEPADVPAPARSAA